MLSRQDLIDAHEQGLNINTKNGNLKIVAILNDIYGVNHFNSNKVQWWMFEQFERNQATIEQPKPKIDLSILKEGEIYFITTKFYNYIVKFRYMNDNIIAIDSNYVIKNNSIERFISGLEICVIKEINIPNEIGLELFYSKFPELKPKKYNGRAVNCDSLEQANYVSNMVYGDSYTPIVGYFCVCIKHPNNQLGWNQSVEYMENCNYEIISFSQYCQENNIKEPIFIQGFEVGKDYNDVVMVSDDNYGWYSRILKSIANNRFIDNNGNAWMFARYPKKREINEIKFID